MHQQRRDRRQHHPADGQPDDAVYAGSNSNAVVDLLAPGTDVCSAVPTYQDNDGNAVTRTRINVYNALFYI